MCAAGERQKIIGLEGEFGVAKRQEEIEMAEAMKESVYADLSENLFSPHTRKLLRH